MNRKWIAILLSCAMLLMLAAACGKKDNTNNNANNDTNNGVNDGMQGNNTGNNVNDPSNTSPNNGLNGSEGNGSAPEAGNNTAGNHSGMNDTNSGNNSGMNDTSSGNYPTFPNSLATVDADVAVDDLIATLGLTENDLNTAMENISTVGDGVDGARTYRHKLLGHEADVSYGFDADRAINKVTVKADKAHADTWRKEFNDVLGATAVEGQNDTWDYSNSSVKMTEEGDYFIITIEKPQK